VRCVAILQARSNSSRLPGKSLLPIAGIPIVQLAAKRAANNGIEVIVATSDEQHDDYLAAIVSMAGISVYRGSLRDPLNRFVRALDEYPEETVVVRLTGDNVFPDGLFISEMLEEFLGRELRYLTSTEPGSGLPYGVSAEIMYLKNGINGYFTRIGRKWKNKNCSSYYLR